MGKPLPLRYQGITSSRALRPPTPATGPPNPTLCFDASASEAKSSFGGDFFPHATMPALQRQKKNFSYVNPFNFPAHFSFPRRTGATNLS